MKIAPLIAPAVMVLALLAACEQETRPSKPKQPATGNNSGTTPASSPTPAPASVEESEPEPESTPAASAAPSPTPTPAPTNVQNVPYGTPVPGKAGFVESPFSSAGYVDVRGFPPGTEVKDPYSGKIFLVP